jgi:replicative DNA helicase
VLDMNRPLPRSPEAERAVLGGLMLAPEQVPAIADRLVPEDFHRVAHQRLYRLMLDMSAAGRPPDMLGVTAELMRLDRAEEAGGIAYVSGLPDNVPSTENLDHYADIVRERALSRRLVEIAERARDAALGGSGTPAEQIEATQAALDALGAAQPSEGWRYVADLLDEEVIRIQAAAERRGQMSGLPTGLAELDRILCGLQPGNLIVLGARPGCGKAQPLTAKILTPTGWTTMGALKVGDLVIGSNGQPTRVLGVYPQGVRPVFKVRMTDGVETLCCDEHLWATQTRLELRRGDPPSVKSLAEIRASLRWENGSRFNHRVATVEPVAFAPHGDTPIHPYLLGLILGDGSLSARVLLHNPEPDLWAAVERLVPEGDTVKVMPGGVGCRINMARKAPGGTKTWRSIQQLGLAWCDSFTKFIPPAYLRGSIETRIALLQGLCDTDGSVDEKRGSVEYSTSSHQLARDVRELVWSLGGTATDTIRHTFYTYKGQRLPGAPSHRLMLTLPPHIVPVASVKNRAKWRDTPHATRYRSFDTVEPAGEAECQCIMVEAANHQYVTDDFIVTHNTSLAINAIARTAATVGAVGVFSLEMSRGEIVTRLLCCEARVDSSRIRRGTLTGEDWDALMPAAERLAHLPILIDDTPGLTPSQIRARVLKLKALRPDLGLVVVDYLGLIGGHGTDQEKAGAAAVALKSLAKELQIPVVALAQLNRGVESRPDKRPVASDLRDSGKVEQTADVIVLIFRDEYYNRESTRKGEADLLIVKHRNGGVGDVAVAFEAEFTRFGDLARPVDSWGGR